MGSDEAPLAWSGMCLGPGAEQRAERLSDLRRAGTVVALSWAEINIPVIVEEVTIEWRRAFDVRYHIKCTVLPPAPAGAGDEDSDLSDMLDSLPGGSILGALGDAASDVGGVIQDVANTASDALNIARQTVTSVTSVVGPLASALGIQVPFLSSINDALGTATGLVTGLGTAGAGLTGISGRFDAMAAYTSGGLSAADSTIDAALNGTSAPVTVQSGASTVTFGPAYVDAATTPDGAAWVARDAALGYRAGAAIGSAQVASRATVTTSDFGPGDLPVTGPIGRAPSITTPNFAAGELVPLPPTRTLPTLGNPQPGLMIGGTTTPGTGTRSTPGPINLPALQAALHQAGL